MVPGGGEALGESGERYEHGPHPREVLLEQPRRELGRRGVPGHGYQDGEPPGENAIADRRLRWGGPPRYFRGKCPPDEWRGRSLNDRLRGASSRGPGVGVLRGWLGAPWFL